jgi:hypothetical protein
VTNEELTELERLCEEATAGGWTVASAEAPTGATYYDVTARRYGEPVVLCSFAAWEDDGPENAAFIAAARAALPALVAALRGAAGRERRGRRGG